MRRKAAAYPDVLSARAAATDLDRAPVRRGLHRSASRLSRRDGLLPSRQRASRDRAHPRAGVDPDGRGRSVRADRPFHDAAVRRNPAITVVVTPHGGHCAFVEPAADGYDGYWAEREIVRFVTAAHAGLELLHQQPAELRPFPDFFVLEVDEDLAAAGGLLANHVGPPRDVVRRVALVAQPEVAVVGGDLDRRRQLLAVGDAQRQVPRAQPAVHLVVQPRRVPELERRADARRKGVEERVEQREVLLQIRRQLEQQRAELRAERRARFRGTDGPDRRSRAAARRA